MGKGVQVTEWGRGGGAMGSGRGTKEEAGLAPVLGRANGSLFQVQPMEVTFPAALQSQGFSPLQIKTPMAEVP